MRLLTTCSPPHAHASLEPTGVTLPSCRVIAANAERRLRQKIIISIVARCGVAKQVQKTPTFPSPQWLTNPPPPPPLPYHAQMFPIKGPRQPLRPEYVNQHKEPFRERRLRGCTLLFSLSLGYNTHFQDGEPPPPVPRGHRRLERSEQNT